MQGGFIYLCAVMDWYSRAVLAWELSNTLDAGFCARAVERAIAQYGVPEIFNTDQGSQFTSAEFTQPLLARGIKLSMDSRGRALDNVFVERLWRTVKYDEVYLKSYRSQIDAYTNLETFTTSAGPTAPSVTRSHVHRWNSTESPSGLLSTNEMPSIPPRRADSCGKPSSSCPRSRPDRPPSICLHS